MATREIISGDYKSAILRLMQLGEACPQHIFDNAGIFNAEEIASIETLCSESGKEISVLATSNSTESTNEEICRTYYKRRYQDKDGYMIMLDTVSGTVIAVSEGDLPSGTDDKLEAASTFAASKNYINAVETAVSALKG